MIIADANAWIDFIKRPNFGTGAVVRDLLREERVALTGVVLAEVLRGLRSEDTPVVQGLMDAVPYLDMDKETWITSGLIAQALDTRGLRIPMTDVFVAAVALTRDHEILTRDKHFERIPGVRLYEPQGDDDA